MVNNKNTSIDVSFDEKGGQTCAEIFYRPIDNGYCDFFAPQ